MRFFFDVIKNVSPTSIHNQSGVKSVDFRRALVDGLKREEPSLPIFGTCGENLNAIDWIWFFSLLEEDTRESKSFEIM